MLAPILEYLAAVADAFLNPQKRVFVGYLASAALIALAVATIASRAGGRDGFSRAFGRSVWWSRSARADYLIVFINRAVMMLLAPRLLGQLAVATAVFTALHDVVGAPPGLWPELPAWSVALGFTVVHFLLDDLSRYLVHRLLHRSALLWPFHEVHHTAETLTPFTVYRTHPVEGVLFALRSAVVQGCTISTFVFCFGDRVDLVTLLGANVFLFAFNAAGANLRHSHVPIRYGRFLERVLISPAQHQIHHSLDPRHHDRNFGTVLAVWDRLGGTLVLSEPGERLRFGTAAAAGRDPNTLRSLYIEPVLESARVLYRALKPAVSERTIMPTSTIRHLALFVVTLFLLAPLAARPAGAAGEIDIYSHRQPYLIDPFIKRFTEETGIKVNIVYASEGLAQRLLVEGERSPADVVLTVDIGRLAIYADKDLLARVDSPVLQQNIPAHLRDPNNRWFGFSIRARVVAIAKGRVDPNGIKRMEDLADPKWQGRICTRPGSHVYNRGLMASMIAAHGEAEAQAWAEGLVNNLARRPQGDDRAQVKAIYEGECDVAIINHYYYGKLKTSETPEHRAWADAVEIVFTNQEDRGNHINISGGGVAKHADNKADAVRFLEFLAGEEAQRLYAAVNTEYPANPEVEVPPELKEWGTFKADDLPIARIAELAAEAQMIIDTVGW